MDTASISFKSIWDTLSKIDCRDHLETKRTGKTELSYLSWTWAWAEAMKAYPEATYSIREWEGRPWLNDPVAGVLVMTSVNIGGNERTMWLAAMDGANNALKDHDYTYTVRGYNGPIEKTVKAVDMCDINKAIMRCLVKNLAMFGLGLNVYAGEDLPVGADEPAPETANVAKKQARTPSVASAPVKSANDTTKSASAHSAADAWNLFKTLSSIKSMTNTEHVTALWGKIVKDETGKASARDADAAGVEKLYNRIAEMKAKEVANA